MTERVTARDAMNAAAEAKAGLAAHEDICAERYRRLDEQLGDVKEGLKWLIRICVTVLLSLVAYFGNQVIGG